MTLSKRQAIAGHTYTNCALQPHLLSGLSTLVAHSVECRNHISISYLPLVVRQFNPLVVCDGYDFGRVVDVNIFSHGKSVHHIFLCEIALFLTFGLFPEKNKAVASPHCFKMSWLFRAFVVDKGHEGL